MEYLWTAFVIGLAGSFHCVGMCGAIALALPRDFASAKRMVAGRILYNLGRVVTYSAIGAVFGLFGKAVALAGFQQTLSIILGVLLLAAALFSFNLESNFIAIPVFRRLTAYVKTALGRLLKVNSQSSLFLIGILNGLLPCGFVYLALAGSVAAGTMVDGAMYMALFGLGTFPLMFITSLLGSVINLNTRNLFRKLTPVFFAVFACLFIIRGLNLGIPYLSPAIGTEVPVKCH